MWRALIQLASLLPELSALLREQNALLRELIQAQTHLPARTPRTIHSLTSAASSSQPKRSIPRYTDKDVFTITREMRQRQDLVDQTKRQIPWRDPDQPFPGAEPTFDTDPSAAPTTTSSATRTR